MQGLGFLILLSFSIFRAIKHMYFNFRWRLKSELYREVLSGIYNDLSNNKELVETLGNLINPVQGIGVEDIWIRRTDDSVKRNTAIITITNDQMVQEIIQNNIKNTNKRISKSSLQHHLLNSLLHGWNRKEKMAAKYQPIQQEILSFVNALKSVTKQNFRKLAETESIESIRYTYSVVFFKRYTFNLYKTAVAIYLFELPPIAYYNFVQRQPYFDSLNKYVEVLNEADFSTPIRLEEFGSRKVNNELGKYKDLWISNNERYISGKRARTMMWIILSFFWAPICVYLS